MSEKKESCFEIKCIKCEKKNDCDFHGLVNQCVKLAVEVFHPLEDNSKSSKFAELLTMLGIAVGLMRKLGLEQEFLDSFPNHFKAGVKIYLNSINFVRCQTN